MLLPSDTQTTDWLSANLQMWSDTDIVQLNGEYPSGTPYSVQLAPLEAKALHVLGLLVHTFNAAGHMLYFGERGPTADFYLQAYLLACTAIELLTRCKRGDPDLRRGSNQALKEGFRLIGLDTVGTAEEEYDLDKLVALRNLAAHGQGVALVRGRSMKLLLHVDLLNGFPERLKEAFDRYHDELFKSPDPTSRKHLAHSGVEPVLYSRKSGQVFRSTIRHTYENIILPQTLPSKVMKHSDWQVYKGRKE